MTDRTNARPIVADPTTPATQADVAQLLAALERLNQRIARLERRTT